MLLIPGSYGKTHRAQIRDFLFYFYFFIIDYYTLLDLALMELLTWITDFYWLFLRSNILFYTARDLFLIRLHLDAFSSSYMVLVYLSGIKNNWWIALLATIIFINV